MTDNLGIVDGAIIENIIAGSGNDKITGNDQANVISGGAGNDIITGGSGADIFEFIAGFGKDTIKDFAAGTDKLKFSDSAGNVITQTNSFTSSVTGSDLLIELTSSDVLTLEGLGSTTFDNTFLEIT